jgi:hypothetical protein
MTAGHSLSMLDAWFYAFFGALLIGIGQLNQLGLAVGLGGEGDAKGLYFTDVFLLETVYLQELTVLAMNSYLAGVCIG